MRPGPSHSALSRLARPRSLVVPLCLASCLLAAILAASDITARRDDFARDMGRALRLAASMAAAPLDDKDPAAAHRLATQILADPAILEVRLKSREAVVVAASKPVPPNGPPAPSFWRGTGSYAADVPRSRDAVGSVEVLAAIPGWGRTLARDLLGALGLILLSLAALACHLRQGGRPDPKSPSAEEARSGFFSLAPNGLVLDADATMARLLGLGEGEPLGELSLARALGPPGRYEAFANCLRPEGALADFPGVLIGRDGVERPVFLSGRAETLPDGRFLVFRGAAAPRGHAEPPIPKDAPSFIMPMATPASRAAPPDPSGERPSAAPASSGAPREVVLSNRLRPLIPLFMRTAFENARNMRSAASQGDFENARRLGHSLKGSARTYGFQELGELGFALEKAASQTNQEEFFRLLAELDEQLAGVVIRFE